MLPSIMVHVDASLIRIGFQLPMLSLLHSSDTLSPRGAKVFTEKPVSGGARMAIICHPRI